MGTYSTEDVLAMSERAPEAGRSRWPIPLLVVLVCVSLAIGWLNWNEVGVSTSVFHTRLFLVGWIAAAVVVVVTVLALSLRRAGPVASWAVVGNVLAIGLVAGLAVGTTDWGAFTLGSWWQFWLTVPLVIGQVAVIARGMSAARPDSTSHQRHVLGEGLPVSSE